MVTLRKTSGQRACPSERGWKVRRAGGSVGGWVPSVGDACCLHVDLPHAGLSTGLELLNV